MKIIDAWAKIALEDIVLEKVVSIENTDECIHKEDKIYKECYDCGGYNKQCVHYLPRPRK